MPRKSYQSVVLSSPEITTGTTYNVYLGGNSSGTFSDGLYFDGTYTPGSLYTSVSISSNVTTVGSAGMTGIMGEMPGMMPNGPGINRTGMTLYGTDMFNNGIMPYNAYFSYGGGLPYGGGGYYSAPFFW